MRPARVREGLAAAGGGHIVILGAGFGGINAAARLARLLPPESGWRITLVDQRNYFLFTPLLYHAATGLVDPTSILFPVRSLTRAPHFNFREARVEGIDFTSRRVVLDDGALGYDALVLALGSVTNFFGRDAALRQALTLKSVPDAIALRNRIIDAFERADVAEDPEERRRCLTFVVVGGGATGIELVGAIRGLIYGTFARQYRGIRPDEARLLLLEAGSTILPAVPRDLGDYSLKRLGAVGVEMRLSCPVEHVDAAGVVTAGGERIPSRTVVWAAGVRPAPVADSLELPKGRGGRLEVDEYLEVPGFPGVFAIGDIAALADGASGEPLPPNAAVAVREGKALARILRDRIAGAAPAPFRYRSQGELVSLGRHEAVANLMGRHLRGFPAWVVWRAFYLSQLMGFRNRLAVALDWSFAYFYQRDTVRLDLPAREERGAG